jgi:glycosyltransferase involved in cell wall biosynthesis
LAQKNTKLVFEIHSIIEKRWIRRLEKRFSHTKVVLGPISEIILTQLKETGTTIPIVKAPMGIDLENLESRIKVRSFVERLEGLIQINFRGLKIGYVGKFWPNGYSKGIEDLFALASLNSREDYGYLVSVMGGLKDEVISARTKLKEYNLLVSDIEISGHVDHSIALTKMRSLDVIILPRPASENYVGFPLKAIESISTGRVVVAARCKVYEDIFQSEFSPFWYKAGDVESLNKAIRSALADNQLETRILNGLTFARQFTWDRRTSKLLELL